MTRSPTALICSLTSPSPDAMRADLLAALIAGADRVECRLDFLATPPDRADLETILAGHAHQAIVTCRPQREGGRFQGDETRRLEILRLAADLGCLAVDVEVDVPPADRPDTKTIILSHHDFAGNMPDLEAYLPAGETTAIPKVAFQAHGPEDALRAMDFLRGCPGPAIALAMGPHGVASRILARKFGAWGSFASLRAGGESAPGQLTIADMKQTCRWDRIGPRTAVFGVIGHPVAHSMSPAIHNAAFEAVGMDAIYVPLLVEPGWDAFHRLMDALLNRPWLDWRGLSVTIPHKENALRYVGAENCDELAMKIGAVNTITIGDKQALRMGEAPNAGRLKSEAMKPPVLGDNTDYSAAIDALCAAMGIARQGLAGREVAVLGAGGAARSVVAALCHYGAAVTVHNRTVSRAAQLAEEFGCRASALGDIATAPIVINCTPLGMSPKVDACPVAELSPAVQVVFDTIYNPLETRLLAMARRRGCVCVAGLEMFVRQAVAQFEIWTGQPAPVEVMRQVVLNRLR